MKLELRRVTADEKPILSNLMEKYLYDFSLYEKTDVSPLGLYGYDWLDCYWTEKNRWAFFITADGKLAGFVMVSDFPELPGEKCDYALAEFFVMNRYKRCLICSGDAGSSSICRRTSRRSCSGTEW